MFKINPVAIKNFTKFISIRSISGRRLIYEGYGDPSDVVKLENFELPSELKADQVQIKWNAAPVNPADINQLQGVYPVKPKLPAIGGNEGCATVEKVGSSVTSLKPGDLVIPVQSGLGTWTTHSVHDENSLFSLNSNLDKIHASVFQVNPPTAYRMLHDFVSLNKGDTVIQNGANSAVGRFAIQLCRIFGWKSINIIRDRPGADKLKKELEGLGADAVYTEEEFAKKVRDITNVRLALNCVGGKSSFQLCRTLTDQGCMVTYGGMSKQPTQTPTGPLIFKDISLRGFWMSHWYTVTANLDERRRMYDKLAQLFIDGELKPAPYKEYPLEEYKKVLEIGLQAKEKAIFVF
ncbi:unnamed protein product [Bursaphelenchus okinawaensis]|uniref:Enoyl-[acyl-carrier-protein] reductase, mitochondrial n=1 Tax=Bursaphelenchus okinawaensis TaxID=465554 RepID=A0A811KP59_9BILA|nr:unnamed protein product [Bursaphelenchus okinawaensis]CAG9107121.1 unnamed protein product [Bursaphelenchus okinawaensis]